jgi:signal transduction histidine kinase
MKNKLEKYGSWLSIILVGVLFFVFYFQLFSKNYYNKLNGVKSNFKKLENSLLLQKNKVDNAITSDQNFDEIAINPLINLHIYKNDTLYFWSTNKIPISKFEDIQFPADGLIKAQNGWYYAQSYHLNGYSYTLSFLIKNEYSYVNEYLENEFATEFNPKVKSSISLDESVGFPIYTKDKHYVFSIVVNEYQPISVSNAIILFSLLVIWLTLILLKTTKLILKIETKLVWFYPILLIVIRYCSLRFEWFGFFKNSELYSPSLYGTNEIFPNFLEYNINILTLFTISYFVFKRLGAVKQTIPKYWFFIIGIIPFIIWQIILFFFQGLIENSSIPLHIEELFKINAYSIIAIISMAIIGFMYFIINKTIIKLAKNSFIALNVILSILILYGLTYIFIQYYFIQNETFTTSCFPILFLIAIALLEYKEFNQKHLVLGMMMLALFAFTNAQIINDLSEKKSKSEKELYANQLLIEKDIVTELEYSNLVKSIRNDRFLQQMISAGFQLNFREFERAMERRHFKGFWERYECKFFLFNVNGNSLLNIQGGSNELLNNLNDYVNNHGVQSEIVPTMYYISDYIGQYSYIIREQINGRNGELATLFVTLKSKKIPEEIGYPRLLISSESSSLHHLDNYSIAKYHNKRLVSQFGTYNYPNSLIGLYKSNPKHLANFNLNGYNHLIQYKSKNDVVVLSNITITTMDTITSFSYLFCLFGLLLLPIYMRYYSISITLKSLALSSKIQFTLISIVVVALVVSAISSGIFIKNQYSSFSELTLKEKVHSIDEELASFINKEKNLSIQENGSLLNYQLMGLSKIFKTDINIYDNKGFLISTSRPNVFNSGLLSEQINPLAKKELILLDKSEFIHTENIGNLNYNSAYAPLYNKYGKTIGFINLQHFGQQEEVEHQIQQFLMSIISVFVLLIACSVIIAIFAASWITNPLHMIQSYLSNIHLGRSNQYINYSKNDEIGALVKSYNKKIDELEYAAQQLAQSERESAWRDMAKQVAHEIKNPLTPMKLSVQHLVRSFDPNDDRAQEKINRVCQSLVEQIDALTKIANEFSNFAKMQKAEFNSIDIVSLITNSAELFREGNQIDILLNGPEQCIINGDKDQLLRVFNNLIKNSCQAISSIENGTINIDIQLDNSIVKIAVKDNGVGIPEIQQSKIFVPYFTTKSTGSGIGLAMVKQIIENHKGIIYFESEVNKGTTFTVELPII